MKNRLFILTLSLFVILFYPKTSLFAEKIHCEDPLLLSLNSELPKLLRNISKIKGSFLSVEPLLNGGKSLINDVYLIKTTNEELVIKIGNARWEKNKTLNEIAVLNFLKENTSIPVPEVYQYCIDKTSSSIGREYIIMEKMPGEPLSEVYAAISQDKRRFQTILSQLANILSELRRYHFDGIGNFEPDSLNPKQLVLKGIIDLPTQKNMPAFHHFEQYVKTYLLYYIQEMERRVAANSIDSQVYSYYLPSLKKIFCSPYLDQIVSDEKFVFSHQDFVMKNILVKDDKVTAILDWEWSGAASKEVEGLSGLDFLKTEEDKYFFISELKKNNSEDLFKDISLRRKKLYKLIFSVYSLVCYREWFEGKLLHTARFMEQKLYQRQIRNSKDISPEEVLQDIKKNLNASIQDLLSFCDAEIQQIES